MFCVEEASHASEQVQIRTSPHRAPMRLHCGCNCISRSFLHVESTLSKILISFCRRSDRCVGTHLSGAWQRPLIHFIEDPIKTNERSSKSASFSSFHSFYFCSDDKQKLIWSTTTTTMSESSSIFQTCSGNFDLENDLAGFIECVSDQHALVRSSQREGNDESTY